MAIGSVYRHLIIFPADAGVNLNIPGSIIFAPDIPRRGGEKLILMLYMMLIYVYHKIGIHPPIPLRWRDECRYNDI